MKRIIYLTFILFIVFFGPLVTKAADEEFPWPMFLPAITGQGGYPPGTTVAKFGVARYSSTYVFGP